MNEPLNPKFSFEPLLRKDDLHNLFFENLVCCVNGQGQGIARRINSSMALHREFAEQYSKRMQIVSTRAPRTAEAKGLQGSFTVQRQIRIALLIALRLGLSGAIAGAQQFSSAGTKPSTGPTPVPLSQIFPQAESTLRIVNSIETALSTEPVIATVQKRFPSLTTEIELRGAEMAKFLVGIVPLELLHSMQIVLQRYGDQLSSWNQDLTARIKTLDNQITRLDGLSKIWKATLQLPELSHEAPEMAKRVQSLIDLIDRTQQAAESLRERDLILQGHILETTARLQAIAPAFEQAQVNVAKNLFVQDSQPLWSLGIEQWKEASQASLIPPASAALLKTYLSHEPAVLYLHAVTIFFLFLALSWLRRRVHTWTEEEPSLQRAAPVFDLPVSTAVTLSFLLFGSIYSMAPFLLRAMLWGLLLISITLILRRLAGRALFPILNALIILYVVDQLRLITSLLPLLGRLVFGAEMLGGTFFLIWLIWSKHSSIVGVNTTKLLGRAIQLGKHIGLVVFPVTLLADVFGSVNFANLLAGGVIRSAYVGAAVYAALRIVEGLIIISLGMRPLGLMRVIRLNRPMLQRRIRGVAEFLALVYWASLMLNVFGLRSHWSQALKKYSERTYQ